MIEWEDKSSWSQKDSKETRAVPKTWQVVIGDFRVTVSRHIYYRPDDWVMNCRPGVFEDELASSKDIDEAKSEAVAMLRSVCERALRVMTDEALEVESL